MAQNPLLAVDFRTDPRKRIVELERAWERYHSGEGAGDALRPAIVDSWERCRTRGVKPRATMASVLMSQQDLAAYRSENPLMEELAPLLDDLSAVIPDSGHLVVVTDHQGLLMHVQGDAATRSRAENMHFAPGTLWTEESAGTNAIGTALATGHPIQILGAEHLCQVVHPWTCSAAPIRNPVTGETLGVIDVTGLRHTVHPHSLAAVIAAARSVEDRLREKHQIAELLVRSEYLRECALAGGAPLAALDLAGRVLAFSPWLAEQGLIREDGRLSCLPPGALSDVREGEREWEVQGRRSERMLLAVRPVRSGSRVAGYLVRIAVQGCGRAGRSGQRYSFASILGRSPALQAALGRARTVADHSLPVLLLGESGTGKEVVAQAIHDAGRRRSGPFVAVNCAAIPSELLASELFGYDRGAFTGARRDGYPGKFEQAAGGTLFLDEIGDMPLESQAHLLRVLEEKSVVRLGGARPIPVDVRIIAATNADLEQRVQEGRFRADLFYRLSAWRICLPPLRERTGDLTILLSSFLLATRDEIGRPPLAISPDAMALLEAYPWPGNIRELKNVATQLALEVAGSAVTPEDLPKQIRLATRGHPSEPAPVTAEAPGLDQTGTWRETETDLLRRTVAACGGNIAEAARRLGIHRSTIYRKLGRPVR